MMSTCFQSGIEAVLRQTPATLRSLLERLPDRLIRATEGGESWSPFDIVGHLVHGERTDWIPRLRIILEHGEARRFQPFDRFAQVHANVGKPIGELLDEFAALREGNLATLASLELDDADLDRRGSHPELGVVTLGQLLCTWAAHDLSHLAQIGRVMAREYRAGVGPWVAYFSALRRGRR